MASGARIREELADRIKYFSKASGCQTMLQLFLLFSISTRIIDGKTHGYLRGVVDINKWRDWAIELKSVADKSLAVTNPNDKQKAMYLMLMGYALENLAKGIILSKSYDAHLIAPEYCEKELRDWKFELKNGNKWGIKTHNLDKLYEAKDLGFSVSASDINILKAMSAYTQWKGRYSVPLDIDDLPLSEPSFEDMANSVKDVYEKAMAEAEKLRAS